MSYLLATIVLSELIVSQKFICGRRVYEKYVYEQKWLKFRTIERSLNSALEMNHWPDFIIIVARINK